MSNYDNKEGMMKTATKQHTWVKHTITPVSVLPALGADGPPAIFVDPDDQVTSEDHAAYGCDACGVALFDNLNTECSGETDVD